MEDDKKDDKLDHIHDPQDPEEFTIGDMTDEEALAFYQKALALMERKKTQQTV